MAKLYCPFISCIHSEYGECQRKSVIFAPDEMVEDAERIRMQCPHFKLDHEKARGEGMKLKPKQSYEAYKNNISINEHKDIEGIKDFIATVFKRYGKLKMSFILESMDESEGEKGWKV